MAPSQSLGKLQGLATTASGERLWIYGTSGIAGLFDLGLGLASHPIVQSW